MLTSRYAVDLGVKCKAINAAKQLSYPPDPLDGQNEPSKFVPAAVKLFSLESKYRY